ASARGRFGRQSPSSERPGGRNRSTFLALAWLRLQNHPRADAWGYLEFAFLPDESQGQLHIPIVINCLGDRAELRRVERAVRDLELRRVQDVEEFRPELKPSASFPVKEEILEQREIKIGLR